MELAFDAGIPVRVAFKHTGLVAPRPGALAQQMRLHGRGPGMRSTVAGVADEDTKTKRVEFHGGLRGRASAVNIQCVCRIMSRVVMAVDGMVEAMGHAD